MIKDELFQTCHRRHKQKKTAGIFQPVKPKHVALFLTLQLGQIQHMIVFFCFSLKHA